MRGTILALVVTIGSVTAINIAAADDAPIQSPSISYVGSAENAAPGRSIVALGKPAVENINVAAVATKPRPVSMPMVIRGGVVGNAFTAPAGAPVKLPASASNAHPGVQPGSAPAGARPGLQGKPGGMDPRLAQSMGQRPGSIPGGPPGVPPRPGMMPYDPMQGGPMRGGPMQGGPMQGGPMPGGPPVRVR